MESLYNLIDKLIDAIFANIRPLWDEFTILYDMLDKIQRGNFLLITLSAALLITIFCCFLSLQNIANENESVLESIEDIKIQILEKQLKNKNNNEQLEETIIITKSEPPQQSTALKLITGIGKIILSCIIIFIILLLLILFASHFK